MSPLSRGAVTTGTSTVPAAAAVKFSSVQQGAAGIRRKDSQRRALAPVMSLSFPPNVKHWHGAKANTWFSHIALEVPGTDTSSEWCEPVADEVYQAL